MTLVDSPTTGRDADPSPEPTDRAWGAFTESAPWVLEESEISWMPLAERLRDRARAEVPELTRPGRIPDLRRLVTVVRHLGWAVGVWWVRKRRGRYADAEASRADLSERLRSAIEILGPTYIKLAQIISSGEGLFPAELVDEFKKCRDQVPAEPFEVVRTTVEADLGARLEDV
ncbi:MAG: AarF/ABC1/UbiB kinase family protein, partial [Actinobacteria bacterium]|nr:AarF/ABC1/UbiB kinase family protein [Actinomycetota bacterium]